MKPQPEFFAAARARAICRSAPATTCKTGPAVVLFHGSAASSRQWHPLASCLRPDWDVHTIDLHGHGAQAPWRFERALTVHDESALAMPLIEAAGGAHLIGHSYGAAVALHLALTRPALVKSLALYEPVVFALLNEHEPNGTAATEVREIAAVIRSLTDSRQAAAAAQRFMDYWSGPSTWPQLDASQHHSMARRMPIVVQHFDAVSAAPLPAGALKQLAMPMLFLSGSQSTAAARRIATLLRALLPAARHETLAGMGHMGPISHAERVNERILDFLQPLSRRRAAP